MYGRRNFGYGGYKPRRRFTYGGSGFSGRRSYRKFAGAPVRRRRRFFGGKRRSGVSFAKYKRAFLVGAVIMIFVMMGMPKVSAAIQSKMRAWFPKLVY